MRRTSWRKTPELSGSQNWTHAGDKEIMSWTVKAIDQDILHHGMGVLVAGGISLTISLYFAAVGDYENFRLFFFPISILAFLFYKQAMQKTVFVYRATADHVEICRWQDIPDLVFIFIRIFPFVMTGLLLMLMISDPKLSIAALAGPALIGIGLASIGSNSEYKKIYRRFYQLEFSWSDIDRGLVDRKQGLVALSVSSPESVIPDEAIDFDNPEDHAQLIRLYFQKNQEKKILKLIEDNSPIHTKFIDGEYKYTLHTYL